MTTSGPSLDHSPRRPWDTFLSQLSRGSVGITIGLAVTAAVMLNPIFVTPFTVLLGRTLFVGMVLLLVYTLARMTPQHWLPAWLPRWLLPVSAVALGAPLFTAAVYVVSVGGDVEAFIGRPARLAGFAWIAGSGLVIGLVTAAVALVRERLLDAERRALALELEHSRLEKQAVDARLSLLQAQIEPHFLFNTLANVQALVDSGSPRAGAVLKSLTAYLRAALPQLHEGGTPTLGKELRLVRAYLELMQMRMPDRLQWSMPPADAGAGAMAELPFPSMALLTLVENAVRHGIDPGEDGGRIDIGMAIDGNQCRAWVHDTGVGMAEDAQPGMGLANLRSRVAACFGPEARLQLSEVQPHGLHAEIHWPR